MHGGTICCRVPEGDRIVAVVPHEERRRDPHRQGGGPGPAHRDRGRSYGRCRRAPRAWWPGSKWTPATGSSVPSRPRATSLLNLHASGMALAVPLDEYPVKGRGAGGVQSVLDRPAGQVPGGRARPCRLPGPDRRDRSCSRTGAVSTSVTPAGQPAGPPGDQLAALPAPRPRRNAPRPSFMDGGINHPKPATWAEPWVCRTSGRTSSPTEVSNA